jgi:hypothetical protein
MDAASTQPSPADVATEVGSLSAVLGIVTMALFPFAIPALVLVIPAVLLVVVPLLPVAVVGGLLAVPVILTRLLLGGLRRARSRRRVGAASSPTTGPAGASARP